VGGHISSQDAAGGSGDPYLEGLRRELDEEVVIETAYTARLVGLINDDESPVGRVHLGVVHLYQVESPRVRPREADLLDAGFRPLAQLCAERDQFETWSQFALDALR
jgi:predicted NUDIX family phosphoesterase